MTDTAVGVNTFVLTSYVTVANPNIFSIINQVAWSPKPAKQTKCMDQYIQTSRRNYAILVSSRHLTTILGITVSLPPDGIAHCTHRGPLLDIYSLSLASCSSTVEPFHFRLPLVFCAPPVNAQYQQTQIVTRRVIDDDVGVSDIYSSVTETVSVYDVDADVSSHLVLHLSDIDLAFSPSRSVVPAPSTPSPS